LNQDNKQDERVALVTGAARRMGAVIATHLHKAGFRVVIHCHESHQEATALAHVLNEHRHNSALVLKADLTKKKEVIELMSKAIHWANRLDVLVNNASIFSKTPLGTDLNDSLWDDLFNTNVRAPFWLSHLVFPHLRSRQGAIINLTDTHVDKPLKGYSVYCQTKAALSMQTKALASEFSPHVRVNGVAPGAIIWPEDANSLNEEQQQKIIAKTLLQRHGDPLFIAQAVLSLIDNPFITGQILVVDGGRGFS
jgi:pteridine reductase